ncbi:MAG: hypothetical protein ACN6O6_14385 [Pseudomonas sp.]|uniref:hypothetical protein n=1 Tax=Pseudomonas sp. TaxID=306 RepID=UPI003D0E8412
MSDEATVSTEVPASDEQRLEALEKGQRLNRILLVALSGVLLMTLASWGTWGLFSLFGTTPEYLTASHIEALQKRAESAERHAQKLDTQLEQLRALIAVQAKTSAAPPPAAPAVVDPSPEILRQVATVMTAQEQSFQHSLGALKNGMRDLAGMIAGSRSWLSDYNEALDKSLKDSQERQKRLQQWTTGAGKPAPRS